MKKNYSVENNYTCNDCKKSFTDAKLFGKHLRKIYLGMQKLNFCKQGGFLWQVVEKKLDPYNTR